LRDAIIREVYFLNEMIFVNVRENEVDTGNFAVGSVDILQTGKFAYDLTD
jgi:hypothetical protein